METFTVGLGDRWWSRVGSRNPLVRSSDRIEAMVLSLAVLLTLVAVPIAGAIDTFVYDAHHTGLRRGGADHTSGDRDRDRRRQGRHATEEPFVHGPGHLECGQTWSLRNRHVVRSSESR